MKFSKTTLQANFNKNRATNRKRYRSQRNWSMSGNWSPTKSKLFQLQHWTKHMKAWNERVEDGEPDATLATKHSCNIIESLPNFPSEIFLHFEDHPHFHLTPICNISGISGGGIFRGKSNFYFPLMMFI